MKAFLVGLIFIMAAALLSGLGVLLFPLLIVLGFFLRVVVGLIFVVLAIWLLGKFIIFVWEKLKSAK
ncbi:MAG: hypothetical protein WC301_05435 [Candidatus Omnitrophota bacterium]|jgi:hypothetical protein